MKAALNFAPKEGTDQDSHADILGNCSGDTGTTDTKFKDEDKEHVSKNVKDAAGSKTKHSKECFSFITQDIVHNAAGSHGRCRDQDPGAVFDRVGKNRIGASKKAHEGGMEEKTKNADKGAA